MRKMKTPIIEPIQFGGVTRLVVENGQWKIDWQLFQSFDSHTLLHLDTYKTFAERDEEDRQKAAAYRKAEEELFRLINAKPLPVGGGDAGKAYLEFCNAEKAKDKATYLKFVTGEQAEFFSKPDKTIGRGGYAWNDNSAVDYQNLKVTVGVTAGNKAVLNVSAARSQVYSNFELRWKVIKQVWKYGKMTRVPLQKNKR
jgi:hypothetical protein